MRHLSAEAPTEARVVVTTTPRDEGQGDYGDRPMVRHPQMGKYRRTRLFVLTLRHSSNVMWLLGWHSSAQTWAEMRSLPGQRHLRWVARRTLPVRAAGPR